MEPQFICMTCKTVIGPIWDDYDNQCNCKDQYDIEVWRVTPVDAKGKLIEQNKTGD